MNERILIVEDEPGLQQSLVDFLHASLKYYPRIRREDLRVVLLHGQKRLLPELSESLGEFAGRKMKMHGLDLRLEARGVRSSRHRRTAGGAQTSPT